MLADRTRTNRGPHEPGEDSHMLARRSAALVLSAVLVLAACGDDDDDDDAATTEAGRIGASRNGRQRTRWWR